MPELQVFTSITFEQPTPADPPEAAEPAGAPLPVVITPIEQQVQAVQPAEPEIEARDGVAKAPRRRETSDQRKKP